MYIRESKTKNKETGTEYSTYKLVCNVRENGLPKQINLLSLGNLEGVQESEIHLLAKAIEHQFNHQSALFSVSLPKHIEELAYMFTQKLIKKQFVESKSIPTDYQEHPEEQLFVEIDINSTLGQTSSQIGGEYLCKQAINELGLDTYLKEELNYMDTQVDNSMLALIGRLLYSSSESQTARWLSGNSAIQEFYPQDSGKVTKNQLYSAANQLYKDKQNIEKYMNQSVEKIYNLKRKIVLYDLTNSYFEGQMKNSTKATFGHNKQKRFDCRQITLGMLTDENGFPIHTQYYSGNISESSTFETILTDLASYGTNLFAGEKPCIIMDAGIATDLNVKL